MDGFAGIFEALTGRSPLRWQCRLHDLFLTGKLPPALDLPTGLGKTSVMAVWLAAKIAGAPLPNRLVYVVDRRVVVDQATEEAEALRRTAIAHGLLPDLPISTLRGQHLDNRRWMEDPTAPAIIVGTVDMIGSRLLFRGYGVSAGMRPFQAGLLGVDTLVVLDEAHLCPPFQALLVRIAAREGLGPSESLGPDAALLPPFILLPLSATGNDTEGAFALKEEDEKDSFVRDRLTAGKRLTFTPSDGKVEDGLVREALALADSPGGRIAVFCTSREVAQKVADRLVDRKAGRPPEAVVLLAGARRVHERERAKEELQATGFLPTRKDQSALSPPTFLVATAAGEVGIDLDADHAVMDLVAAERMIQRLGRVNRAGGKGRLAQVRVIDVAPEKESAEAQVRREACRRLLESLPIRSDGGFDASPGALLTLRKNRDLLVRASTPAPLYPALDRPTLDAWAMTSLKTHPGRPDVAPWLRGWVEEDDPEITLIWRRWPWDEHGRLPDPRTLADCFEAAPPRLLERLEAPRSLALKILAERAKRVDLGDHVPAVLALADRVEELTLAELRDKRRRDPFFERRSADMVFVVRHDLGGLDGHGLLAGDAAGPVPCLDDGWDDEILKNAGLRIVFDEAGEASRSEGKGGWRQVDRIGLTDPQRPDAERYLSIQVWRDADRETGGDPAVRRRVQGLYDHLGEAEAEAAALAERLRLPAPCRAMLMAAAKAHDLGKRRLQWQRAMGAPRSGEPYAKTNGKGANPALLLINGETYRHEFGSLLDLERAPEVLAGLDADLKDLALHLVAAHHGYARPWIAPVDPDWQTSLASHRERAAAAALRFARLQATWGPWGLAWWEALLRAADQRVSRRLDEGAQPAEETA
ncbi:type I-U CRISPR-associated helicase/endonuclease Cas3 [Rhodocista pekingensis]|uniref:Type I-U CRISPR-associated helicase/endonuclease Cas3 n=1 Tax=Rhodocista pekingensis TaxID=201185 RepID=A0ABW2KRL4_9PROT